MREKEGGEKNEGRINRRHFVGRSICRITGVAILRAQKIICMPIVRYEINNGFSIQITDINKLCGCRVRPTRYSPRATQLCRPL